MKSAKSLGHATKEASAGLMLCIAMITATIGCCKTDNGDDPTPLFNTADQQFLVQTSFINYDEMDAGSLAEATAADSVVRQYGRMIFVEYDSALKDLLTAAVSFSVFLQQGPDSTYLAQKHSLGLLSAKSFDTAYLRMEIASDARQITALQAEEVLGQDSLVKEYACKYLPRCRANLAMADSLIKELNFSGGY
jgi:predicted outer membrane protein